jgi:acetyl-CoA C-acetyltransferase
MGNRETGEKFGLTPKARIISTASAGDDPCIMLTAPPAATAKALDRAGLTVADVDLFEINEAFASVVLYFMDRTKVPFERINVAGGAIAMGHPVGATGAALVGTLVNSMRQRNVQHGVVTMCTGLGMGVATVLQRVWTPTSSFESRVRSHCKQSLPIALKLQSPIPGQLRY